MGRSRGRKYNCASEKNWCQDNMIQGKNCFFEWNNTGHSQIWKVEWDYQMTLGRIMTEGENSADGGISQAPTG